MADSKDAEIEALRAEVERLSDWIADTCQDHDICSYNVLGHLCDRCWCHRSALVDLIKESQP